MTVETSTTITGLNAAWPLGTDPRSEGDNHMRLIKGVLKGVFDDGTLAGVLDFVQENVRVGLFSSTEQGIEIQDSGSLARARIVVDPTVSTGNLKVEIYDSTHTLIKVQTFRPTLVATAGGTDGGTIMTTDNAVSPAGAIGVVDFPIGTVLCAVFSTVPNRNAAIAVRLATGSGINIAYSTDPAAGTLLTGTWKSLGVGPSAGAPTFCLAQRVA